MSPLVVIGLFTGFVIFAAVLGIVALQTARADQARRARIEAYAPRKGHQAAREVRALQSDRLITKQMRAINESKRYSESRIGAVKAYITAAGLAVSLTQYWLFCMGCGVAAALLVVLMGYPAVSAPIAFVIVTFWFPRRVLIFMAKRRQKKFTNGFPDSIDVLVRGLKSGLPVGECFRIISMESVEPIAGIFRTLLQEVNAGMTMEAALDRAYRRMPTQELRFFAAAIGISIQTGGNLGEIMSNISGVLRSNVQLRAKIKALSSEAKASTAIVGSLPFGVMAMLYFANYDYISMLWKTTVGYCILGFAGCLMMFGLFIMHRLSQIEI